MMWLLSEQVTLQSELIWEGVQIESQKAKSKSLCDQMWVKLEASAFLIKPGNFYSREKILSWEKEERQGANNTYPWELPNEV